MLTFNQQWNDPASARRQAENAKREIEHWQDYGVYNVFVNLTRMLARRGAESLVDYGCGAGQYRSLALGACGLRKYTGIDLSAPIAEATAWHGTWLDFVKSDGSPVDPIPCDILLCSASIEYAPEPMGMLAWLVDRYPCRWVMLHRVRFHDGPGAFVPEQSWGGVVNIWRWNKAELEGQLQNCAFRAQNWGEQWTYVIEKSR